MKSTFLAFLIVLFLFSTVQAADLKESACVRNIDHRGYANA